MRAPANRMAVAATGPVLVAAGHVLPAGTWLPAVRRTWFPALDGRGRPDHVALTFDDGPDPASTPRFLDALDDLGVRATFFVLGRNLARHAGLGARIAARSHELAVHGWTHRRPWRPAPYAEYRGLVRTVAAVRQAGGGRPDGTPLWYRPPYGILTADRLLAARRAGLRPVLWSAWGRDWERSATPESVLATVLRGLRGGGTVLLHDSDGQSAPGSWRTTLAALPPLVAACRAAGLAVGPLRDHLPSTLAPARRRTPA